MAEVTLVYLDIGSIPGEEDGNPLQYFFLGNPMNREAWWTIVHGVAKSWTKLSTHTYTHTLKNRF